MTGEADNQPPAPEPGLCRTCRHAERIVSGKGSVFIRCGLSAGDPNYPKYPPLPVLVCPGHASREAGG